MAVTYNKLNTKQLALLRLLYRFRFATANQLANALNLNLNNPRQIHSRLQLLLDQKYIGRNYNGRYKINGRPAEYFLLEDGINALKRQLGDKCSTKVLHNIYKDKSAKPAFVAHNLQVFSIYCRLKERYGDDLRFFTKSQLADYRHLPKQLPDALVRLNVDGTNKEFFLEVMDPSKQFYTYVTKVERYIAYSDEGTWTKTTDSAMPIILVVANNIGTEIRFQKRSSRLLKKNYDEFPKVFTANKTKLASIPERNFDRIWRNAEEPDIAVVLHDI